MKGQWHWIGAAIAVLAVAGGIWTMQTSASTAQQTRAVTPELLPHEQAPSVGWVFGRLIGVPGADKPLMNGSGIASRPVQIPPASSVQR